MLTPPVLPMLARSASTLPRPDALPGGLQFEAKVDGFRCILFTGKGGVWLQSRSGSLALTRAFPELLAAAEELRDEELVLDGELVIQDEGRLDFPALQQRARHTGARARELAARTPAHLVLFDLLQIDGQEVLHAPLRERRRRLEDLFARRDLAAPWTLCPATDDPEQAAKWLQPAWGQVGIVCKAQSGTYRPGERGWTKVRSRASAEAIIGGITGHLHRPVSVLLGRWTADGDLRLVARSTPLPHRLSTDLAALLLPAAADHPWNSVRFSAGWGSRETLNVTCVLPYLVGEFEGDTAVDNGRWRHPVRLTRLRPDRTPETVTGFDAGP